MGNLAVSYITLPSNRENEDNGRHTVPRIRLTASIAMLHKCLLYDIQQRMTDVRVEGTRLSRY